VAVVVVVVAVGSWQSDRRLLENFLVEKFGFKNIRMKIPPPEKRDIEAKFK